MFYYDFNLILLYNTTSNCDRNSFLINYKNRIKRQLRAEVPRGADIQEL